MVVFAGYIVWLTRIRNFIYRIFTQGIGYLNLEFFTNFASRRPADAGIKAAIFGSIWLMVVTAPVSIVLGVGCAIYLRRIC